MAGNSFGQAFKITTFGESHGKGVGVIIDGCPSKIPLLEKDFIKEMARRRPGRTSFDTPRSESDQVEIVSGVFEGLTTGAPIALFIRNHDVKSEPYEILRELFRPGHADYTYFKKYGHFDFRGGGRSSARETAARVAAGVVARKVLEPLKIRIVAYTLEMGGIRAVKIDPEAINTNPFYCPDAAVVNKMRETISRAKEEGDSIGGIVEVRVNGCPAGLGEPVFDKLSADLAKAVMSVGAVKGVEIGSGFEAARLKGSENNDPITPGGFKTNRAGGILGGISNGDDIVLRAAVKPIPSIMIEQDTIDRKGRPASLRLTGRFDVSAVPRIVPVLEAMVRVVLADHYLRSKAIS
ncbi:MAG: chorismate synthase [Deltaproteobacteria bacterium]|nr:chorismate synthase [Deltaproteobacteria bacterium]